MHEIRIDPPEVRGREASFRFRVEPPSALFRREGFTLAFPETADLAAVPASLWWTAAIACLHPLWPVLRPCRVRLPVALPEEALGIWRRLLAQESAVLDAYRGEPAAGGVDLEASGPPLPAPVPRPDRGRAASAFSGGKDSLLQAGLLAELTERPVLVPVTSPLTPGGDHEHPRRRRAIDEVARRLPVEVVEVRSDLRAGWDNRFPRRLGFRASANELADTWLYAAATVLAATARGAGHAFLASESEVSQTAEVGGRVVQLHHAMYAFPAQRALDALVRPEGLRFGSLTWALHSNQVQELLWTRYPGIRDLQSSCYKAVAPEPACSRCSQCLRLALGALALDDDPALLGVDLARVLAAHRRWDPSPADDPARAGRPDRLVTGRLNAQALRHALRVPPERVAARLRGASPLRAWRARRAFAALRRRAAALDPGPAPGIRAAFLAHYDPLLADRVGAIFRSRFAEEPEAAYAGDLGRNLALAAEALGAAARP